MRESDGLNIFNCGNRANSQVPFVEAKSRPPKDVPLFQSWKQSSSKDSEMVKRLRNKLNSPPLQPQLQKKNLNAEWESPLLSIL